MTKGSTVIWWVIFTLTLSGRSIEPYCGGRLRYRFPLTLHKWSQVTFTKSVEREHFNEVFYVFYLLQVPFKRNWGKRGRKNHSFEEGTGVYVQRNNWYYSSAGLCSKDVQKEEKDDETYSPSCLPTGSSYRTPTQKPGARVSALPTYFTSPRLPPGSTSHLSPICTLVCRTYERLFGRRHVQCSKSTPYDHFELLREEIGRGLQILPWFHLQRLSCDHHQLAGSPVRKGIRLGGGNIKVV